MKNKSEIDVELKKVSEQRDELLEILRAFWRSMDEEECVYCADESWYGEGHTSACLIGCAEKLIAKVQPNNMETKHTPLPWKVEKSTGGRIIEGANGLQIVKFQSNTIDADEDAAFIVRAVNAHEELLGLLNEAVQWYSSDPDDVLPSWYEASNQAIAKAEGK